MSVTLGKKYRDTITGFTGVAVARSEWLHGCDRITLQAPIDKDGKVPDHHTFDAAQIVDVEAPTTPIASSKPGGPRPEPTRNRI